MVNTSFNHELYKFVESIEYGLKTKLDFVISFSLNDLENNLNFYFVKMNGQKHVYDCVFDFNPNLSEYQKKEFKNGVIKILHKISFNEV